MTHIHDSIIGLVNYDVLVNAENRFLHPIDVTYIIICVTSITGETYPPLYQAKLTFDSSGRLPSHSTYLSAYDKEDGVWTTQDRTEKFIEIGELTYRLEEKIRETGSTMVLNNLLKIINSVNRRQQFYISLLLHDKKESAEQTQ